MTSAAALVVASAMLGQVSLSSEEIVHQRCISDLITTEVTLFGNGTVRVREEIDGRRDMLLADLSPSELDDFIRRFEDVDLREAESAALGAALHAMWTATGSTSGWADAVAVEGEPALPHPERVAIYRDMRERLGNETAALYG